MRISLKMVEDASHLEIDVNERNSKSLEELVTPWGVPKAEKYCFYNTNVVDVLKGCVVPSASVYTEGGTICKITCSADENKPADGYKVIDGSGKYLMPGLFDNHVHVTSVPGEKDLASTLDTAKTTALVRVRYNLEGSLKRGFTTLRDCGGAESYIKRAIEEGSIKGPRLITCGHAISQTGGHGDMRRNDIPGDALNDCACHINNLGVVADGVPECYKAAREEFRRGGDFIKIMAGGGVASPTDKISNVQFCKDEIKAIVNVADTYHSYVTAHAYTPEAIKNCITLGVRGIEHGNLIDDETAALMAEKGCYLTPTLVTYKILASEQFRTFLKEENAHKNLSVLRSGLRALQIAKRHGVKICYGSDLLGSLNGYQTQEFFIRNKVLSAHEIILSATVTPAELNGLGDTLGQVKVGYTADLLLMNGNPLEDIYVLDEPETNLVSVMKDGCVCVARDCGGICT
ncbi:LADA_0B00892g1_1 [Lachancea dasiensis]|uniref:LADA_0B00892g1_1 n=1 Tax=Lachancea dasiensis TaxID=1072105 RepID=A0A1G4IS76_9SACH|nr:LADA_0B00892g1_1 [Lachancea dasiensis]